MKKNEPTDPNVPDEVNFSGGVRGKYAERYAKGTNVVLLEPDVAKVYRNSDSVNRALRELIASGKGPT
jgi:hypothetical protein